jgi:hypothetical protein
MHDKTSPPFGGNLKNYIAQTRASRANDPAPGEWFIPCPAVETIATSVAEQRWRVFIYCADNRIQDEVEVSTVAIACGCTKPEAEANAQRIVDAVNTVTLKGVTR